MQVLRLFRKNGVGEGKWLWGGFYWVYSMDVYQQDVENQKEDEIRILQKTLNNALNQN